MVTTGCDIRLIYLGVERYLFQSDICNRVRDIYRAKSKSVIELTGRSIMKVCVRNTVVLVLASGLLFNVDCKAAPTGPPGPPPGMSPTHYVSLTGGHNYPYDSWAGAATNIQDAVDAASDGDTVLVADGIYALSSEILIQKEISVKSVNGPEVTIADGGGVTRCFSLVTSALVNGFTIQNGRARHYFGNEPSEIMAPGGGIYGGTAVNCYITGNRGDFGGGVLRSTLYNCVVVGNHAIDEGGGIYGGIAYNCTIVGNVSLAEGGGTCETVVRNSIVWSNSASATGDDIYEGQSGASSYSCSPDLPHGVNGSTTNAPLFLDSLNGNYRLFAASPCIDAALNTSVMNEVDLDGNERIVDGDFNGVAIIDMGAYEFQAQEVSVDIMLPTINLSSKGRTPVSIATTDTFDAATIDPSSVRFAEAEPVHKSLEDVDGDGDIDLKLHFMTSELVIEPDDTEVMLVGQTYSGNHVVGISAVKLKR